MTITTPATKEIKGESRRYDISAYGGGCDDGNSDTHEGGGEGPYFFIAARSFRFIFMPPGSVMSPGFIPAGQAPCQLPDISIG